MPPPSPLTRRPQFIILTLEELLEHVRRGKVRIPKFQRPFQWKPQDIRNLLDSVYRGYPIGTLLFWKQEAPAARLELGPVKVDAPHTTQALWVLDGQQRIIALTGVLLHPPLEGAAAQDAFGFYFDLEEEDFVRPSGQAPPLPHWLPMNVVLDAERLLSWLERYADQPRYTAAALRLGKLLREYPVAAYLVEADDPEVPVAIFERLNSASTPLDRAAAFSALEDARSWEQPSNLRDVVENLRQLEFGTIEKAWLRKAASAISGRPLLAQKETAEALSLTARAMRGVIIFFKRDAGIPHVELIPQKRSLVVLARFFHLHPSPSSRSRELLARWIWRTALRGFPMRRSLGVLGSDEERSVQELLAISRRPLRPGIPIHHEFDFETAASKLQANALIALQPRELRTGHPISVYELLEQQGEESFVPLITSAPSLEEGTPGPRENRAHQLDSILLRSIINRIFHPVIQERAALEFLRSSPPPAPEILHSHAIPDEALEALRQGHTSGFLSMRRKLLQQHFETFLNSRARWGESDRGSLQSLIVLDEED